MNDKIDAETLARTWIECWNQGTPDLIPLAEHFTHTSPYGRVEGRRTYLDWVKPLAKQNVTHLNILRTLSNANEAVIHFEMQTPNGLIQVCDWVVVESGEIKEIHSFYDATGLRK
jgi:hypothetical protein